MSAIISPSESNFATSAGSIGRLRVGDWVVVRSATEIFATLDASGRLDGMPFMPEMLRYCGRPFRVGKVAHKTCDTISSSGGRRLFNTVHLEGLRCDGSAHGGCEAGCTLFWNTAWLTKAGAAPAARGNTSDSAAADIEASLRSGTGSADGTGDNQTVWRCQATTLLDATTPLAWWDVRQYVADVRSGNHRLGHLLRILSFAAFRRIVETGIAYRLLVGAFNAIQARRRKPPYPIAVGDIPLDSPTPTEESHLQPGEWVEVKSADEIRATINKKAINRGMRFDVEMLKYCGGRFRVDRRVTRIINERTGQMMLMKNPCILLEDVYCRAECTPMRLGCPRAVNTYWREIWLRRIPDRGRTLTAQQTSGD